MSRGKTSSDVVKGRSWERGIREGRMDPEGKFVSGMRDEHAEDIQVEIDVANMIETGAGFVGKAFGYALEAHHLAKKRPDDPFIQRHSRGVLNNAADVRLFFDVMVSEKMTYDQLRTVESIMLDTEARLRAMRQEMGGM